MDDYKIYELSSYLFEGPAFSSLDDKVFRRT